MELTPPRVGRGVEVPLIWGIWTVMEEEGLRKKVEGESSSSSSSRVDKGLLVCVDEVDGTTEYCRGFCGKCRAVAASNRLSILTASW